MSCIYRVFMYFFFYLRVEQNSQQVQSTQTIDVNENRIKNKFHKMC